MVPIPAVAALPGNLFKNADSTLDLPNQKLWAWGSAVCILTSPLCDSDAYLKWVTCRHCVFRYFFIPSDDLCLLICICRPFTFNIVIDKFGFRLTSLVICFLIVSSVFHYSVSLFLPSLRLFEHFFTIPFKIHLVWLFSLNMSLYSFFSACSGDYIICICNIHTKVFTLCLE